MSSNEYSSSGEIPRIQSAEEDALKKDDDLLEQKQIASMDQERESIVEAEARWLKQMYKEREPELETEAESLQDAKEEPRQNLTEKKISNEPNLTHKDQQLNGDQEISSEKTSFDMNRNNMEQLSSPSHNKQQNNEFSRNGKNNLEEEEEEFNQKMRLKLSNNFDLSKKNQEEYSSSRKTAESTQSFEFEDLISYLNEHRAVIEEALTDEDKERIKIILNLGRDLKILYKDAIETIKADLVKYYEVFKSKWELTMQDLNKLEQIKQDKLQ